MNSTAQKTLAFVVPAIVTFAVAWLLIDRLAGEGDGEPMANRLINEKSPYLLAHAYNPVDWYAWGDEAFEAAKKEDKLIFVSIGYSTCHWCHVMEEESFSDSTVAAMMNANFINIKVDREERPDLDEQFMQVCQMMHGRGGWPLNVILTPDGKPFYADTYIARETEGNRLGMLEAIPKLSNLWKTDRTSVMENAESLTKGLMAAGKDQSGEALGEDILDSARIELAANYDEQYGGFGRMGGNGRMSYEPKFPRANDHIFLLRNWKRSGDSTALAMVTNSLRTMRNSGMFDHLGFGFHRYTVDREWKIPHFEKMLYDQAMLALTYTEAYEATGEAEFKQTAEEIFTYVQRDLTSPEGGFYSAENAVSEGVEGKYYTWTAAEIDAALSPELATVVKQYYRIEADGNWTNEKGDRVAILHGGQSPAQFANDMKTSPEEFAAKLEQARQILLKKRLERERPSLDDKILTDWNGLMIAAYARAGRVFNNPELTAAGEKAASFIMSHLQAGDGRLLHRFREGEAGILPVAEDYTHLTWGLIELYETTFELKYLESALQLTDRLIEDFWDVEDGGLFTSAAQTTDVLTRQKKLHDGVTPSANSVAKLNMLRLARLTGKIDLEKKSRQIGKAFAEAVRRAPSAYCMYLAGFEFAVGPSYEIVLVVNKRDERADKMIQAIREPYIPNKVVLLRVEDGTIDKRLNTLAEFTEMQSSIDGEPTVYVCRNFSCNAPVTTTSEVLELLN